MYNPLFTLDIYSIFYSMSILLHIYIQLYIYIRLYTLCIYLSFHSLYISHSIYIFHIINILLRPCLTLCVYYHTLFWLYLTLYVSHYIYVLVANLLFAFGILPFRCLSLMPYYLFYQRCGLRR